MAHVDDRDNGEVSTAESPNDFEKVTPQKISVSVCTSARESNVQGLMDHLRSRDMSEYVEKVTLLELPFNDLDKFQPDWSDNNALIVCHSVYNRRFAITDVIDALYDSFLHKAKEHFGPNKVFVIVHDLDWPIRVRQVLMDSFKLNQPTTFESAQWVFVCGKLERNNLQMTGEDTLKLLHAVKYAHKHPVNDWSPTYVQIWISYFVNVIRYIQSLIVGGQLRMRSADNTNAGPEDHVGLNTECAQYQDMLLDASKE